MESLGEEIDFFGTEFFGFFLDFVIDKEDLFMFIF